jgi:hypothetical protein
MQSVTDASDVLRVREGGQHAYARRGIGARKDMENTQQRGNHATSAAARRKRRHGGDPQPASQTEKDSRLRGPCV